MAKMAKMSTSRKSAARNPVVYGIQPHRYAPPLFFLFFTILTFWGIAPSPPPPPPPRWGLAYLTDLADLAFGQVK